MKNLNHLLLIVSEDDVWQMIFPVQKFIHKISVLKKSSSQRVINQNVSKTFKKIENSQPWVVITCDVWFIRSCFKAKNVKIVLVSWKQNQKIEITKNEISSHSGNIYSICRFDKFQNEKLFFELFNHRKITFLECDRLRSTNILPQVGMIHEKLFIRSEDHSCKVIFPKLKRQIISRIFKN